MKHLSLFFLLLLYTLNAFSYVTSKSETGKDIKWTLAVDDLVIYVNPVPLGSSKTQDITSSDVMTILNESIDQWNNYSSSNLKAIYTTQLPASKNKLFFSSNTSYFGSGVLAITEINYNVETGAISSADIIINESAYNILTFTKQETESSYLQA